MALNRIPFGWTYQFFKPYFKSKTDGLNNLKEYSLEKVIDISMNYFFEEEMEENGMDKLVLFINAFLYAMEHGEVDPNLAQELEQYIKDFETGEYDDLFTKEDLSLIRADIETIKPYLNR